MHESTIRLFAYIAGFGFLTFLVYLACMYMVKLEDRKQAARKQQVR